MRNRSACLFRWAIWLALAQASFAQEAEDLATPPVDLGLPAWNHSLSLRAGAGYKDNLLLNNEQREESSYILSGLDLFLFRLPEAGRQFYFFLSAEDIRYLTGEKVRKEQLVAAQAQLKKDFGNGWQSAFSWQYVFQDGVFDASLTETNLGTAKVQGHTATLKPWLARHFGGGWRLEAELPVSRQYFLKPLDDYWEAGSKVTLAREIGKRSDLALNYSFTRRSYDTRGQTDAQGLLRPGDSLNFHQREVGLAWQQYWDPQKHWRTQTRFDYGINRDDGGGYFDYVRYRLSQNLRWHSGPWDIRAQVKFSRYDYQRQRGSGTNPDLRYRDGLGAGVKMERKLVKHLTAFATYDYERAVGNQLFDKYDVNTFSAGMEWEY